MPYFYQHENGTIIRKPDIVVDMGGGRGEYFNSPFCLCWWHSDSDEIPDAPPPDANGKPQADTMIPQVRKE